MIKPGDEFLLAIMMTGMQVFDTVDNMEMFHEKTQWF